MTLLIYVNADEKPRLLAVLRGINAVLRALNCRGCALLVHERVTGTLLILVVQKLHSIVMERIHAVFEHVTPEESKYVHHCCIGVLISS